MSISPSELSDEGDDETEDDEEADEDDELDEDEDGSSSFSPVGPSSRQMAHPARTSSASRIKTNMTRRTKYFAASFFFLRDIVTVSFEKRY